MNHYEVLGVPMGADPAEIRRAYVRLARRHHPDRRSAEGAEAVAAAQRRMQDINAAWEVLGDPGSRRRYDDAVRAGTAEGPVRPAPAGPRGPAGKPWRPLADDTAWMDDFEAWRHEDDDLVAPDRPPAPGRRILTMLPVAVFAAAVAMGSVAMVLQSRPLLAVAFVGVAFSAGLFVLVPMVEMTRGAGRPEARRRPRRRRLGFRRRLGRRPGRRSGRR